MVICTDKTIGLGKKTGISYRTAWRWWKQGNLTGYQLPSGTTIITDNNPSKPDAELKDNGLFWFLCGNEVYTDRISAK